ncbi:MAG: hypothetical protein QG620_309 [Patescibacteria group bacterium]|nr:hypothetical protein [Patescibacteria group bacterium]
MSQGNITKTKMMKNVFIVILSLTTLAGGIYWVMGKDGKAELVFQESLPANIENAPAENMPVQNIVPDVVAPSPAEIAEAEEKRQVEEQKKIWLERYQIGASHPNSYDPATFQAVDEFYARDKNNAYFVEISSQGTAKSFQTVYKIGVVAGADPKTFQSAVYPYSKDSRNVYYYGKKISGMDAETFLNLGMNYAKDEDYAYFENVKILSADVGTFVHLNGYYAKDAKAVYYNGGKIAKAETLSFIAANAREAYDNNYNYYDGKIKDKRQQ